MKKSFVRKPISILLSLLMVLSVFGGMAFTASAESKLIGKDVIFKEGDTVRLPDYDLYFKLSEWFDAEQCWNDSFSVESLEMNEYYCNVRFDYLPNFIIDCTDYQDEIEQGLSFLGITFTGSGTEADPYTPHLAFGEVATTWDGEGEGTEESPWLIKNLDDLLKLSANIKSGMTYKEKYFKLTADIDCGSESWEPIGDGKKFSGAFDGDGHTITYIVNCSGVEGYKSLFYGLSEGGVIENLKVDGSINSTNEDAVGFSGVVVYNEGTIRNCHSDVDITAYFHVSGIAWNWTYTAVIDHCVSSGTLTCPAGPNRNMSTAGITQDDNGGAVTNCVSLSDIFAPNSDGSSRVGRLIGDYYGGPIENNYYLSTAQTSGEVNTDCGTAKSIEELKEIGQAAYDEGYTVFGLALGASATDPAVENVIALIDALGTVEYTPHYKAKLDAAQAAYDALTDEQKVLVANYDALTDAKADFEANNDIIDSGKFGDLYWAIDSEGVLTFSGSGAIPHFLNQASDTSVKLAERKDIKKVIINESVTSIGSYGLSSLSNMTDLVFTSAPTLSDSVFRDCGKLVNVTLPEGMTTIPYLAFFWDNALVSIKLPSTITTIENQAFYMTSKLKRVTLPTTATLGGSAFEAFGNTYKTFVFLGAPRTFRDGELAYLDGTDTVCVPEGCEFHYPGGTRTVLIINPAYADQIDSDALEEAREMYEEDINEFYYSPEDALEDVNEWYAGDFNVDNPFALGEETVEPYTSSIENGVACPGAFGGARTVVYTAADLAAANNATDKINAIGTVEYTADCKAKLDAARAAYDALTDTQKLLVDNYDTLTAAESTYAELKAAADQAAADAVIALIDAIGTPEYTDACKAKIDAAKDAYDALDDDQKADVANYETLTEAEEAYAALEEAAALAAAKEKLATLLGTIENQMEFLYSAGQTEAFDDLAAKANDAFGVYLSSDSTVAQLNEAYDTLYPVYFNSYKTIVVGKLNDEVKEDDSDAVKNIAAEAVTAINAIDFDAEKSADELTAPMEQIYEKALSDIADQRAADFEAAKAAAKAELDAIDANLYREAEQADLAAAIADAKAAIDAAETVADVETALTNAQTAISALKTAAEYEAEEALAAAKAQLTDAIDTAKAFYDTIKDEEAYADVADTLDTVIEQAEALLSSDDPAEILAKAEQVASAAAAAAEQKNAIDEAAAALADAKAQLTAAVDAAKAFRAVLGDNEKYAEIANALETAYERGESALASDDPAEILDFAANVLFALDQAQAEKAAADAEPDEPETPDDPTPDEPTKGACPICGKVEHEIYWVGVVHAVIVFVKSLIFEVLLSSIKISKK